MSMYIANDVMPKRRQVIYLLHSLRIGVLLKLALNFVTILISPKPYREITLFK
jgi:hypothetical protein